jgi:hypothetical protein
MAWAREILDRYVGAGAPPTVLTVSPEHPWRWRESNPCRSLRVRAGHSPKMVSELLKRLTVVDQPRALLADFLCPVRVPRVLRVSCGGFRAGGPESPPARSPMPYPSGVSKLSALHGPPVTYACRWLAIAPRGRSRPAHHPSGQKHLGRSHLTSGRQPDGRRPREDLTRCPDDAGSRRGEVLSEGLRRLRSEASTAIGRGRVETVVRVTVLARSPGGAHSRALCRQVPR